MPPTRGQQFYQLIVNLRHPDERLRSGSIAQIPAIAAALGVERTLKEFIPYLTETSLFTEPQWIDVFGFISQIRFDTCPVKEALSALMTISRACGFESRGVQSAIQVCISSIVESLPEASVSDVIQPLLLSMIRCADSPAVRASAVVIFSRTIALMSANLQLKAALFCAVKAAKMEGDPSALVRYALCSCAGNIFRHLKGSFATNLIGIVTTLAGDPSVWVACEVPKFLVAYMEVAGQVDRALSIGVTLLDSQDWHVRCGFVLALADIFRSPVSFGLVFPILERAVMDTEDEVVTAAAEQLPFVAGLKEIDKERVQKFFDHCSGSTCAHVKATICKSLPLFFHVLPSEFVANCLLKLSQDSAQHVKILAIESLKSEEIPLPTKIECIRQAIEKSDWRERNCLVDLVPKIYSPDFDALILQLLFDDACDVRKAMLAELPNLVAASDTLKDLLTAEIQHRMAGDDYQLRQTALIAVLKCGLAMTPTGQNVLAQAAEDAVANVRLALAAALPRLPEFRDLRDRLGRDPDEDVRDAIV